jgi:sulfide:quinone oxidoreductase
MTEHDLSQPHRVLIAGGGVGGLEAMIALRHLAGRRVATTLLAPTDRFTIRALSVGQPFGREEPPAYDVAAMCAHHDAAFRPDAVAAVRPDARIVVTDAGDELPYDSLLVAVGARAIPVLDAALTFRGLQDADAMHELLRETERGSLSRIAFVVPPGATWPLPLYELAMLTAEHADRHGLELMLTIVTPEPGPLAIFGREASEQVDRALAEHGIVLRTDCQVRGVEDGTVLAAPGGVEVQADRVVALPRLQGPALDGLPSDPNGFLPVDETGAVPGVAGVFAAGDGTTMPIKQGGVAAQQADVAARAIAARAGADVAQRPFLPKLRGQLLAGAQSIYLRQAVAGGAGEQASQAADHALWWPPSKVAAPYLASYLERLDAGDADPVRLGEPRALHAQGDPAGGIETLGS